VSWFWVLKDRWARLASIVFRFHPTDQGESRGMNAYLLVARRNLKNVARM